MQIRSFLLIVILGITATLAALNWDAFNTPTSLWLGVTSVEAPIGLVMLGVVAVLTLFFLLSIGYLQSLSLLESRRHAKELQANRELADQAEASRFSELKRVIDVQVLALTQHDAETRATLIARLNQLDASVTASIEQSGNSLAAYIGEMDDRLEHAGNVVTAR
jgi:Na+-transporting methylmalonyl-CoA/oxaloacetate decarboxylase gamma subunit